MCRKALNASSLKCYQYKYRCKCIIRFVLHNITQHVPSYPVLHGLCLFKKNHAFFTIKDQLATTVIITFKVLHKHEEESNQNLNNLQLNPNPNPIQFLKFHSILTVLVRLLLELDLGLLADILCTLNQT